MKNNSKLDFYFPGWTRKSITFSLDDGDIVNDAKFLEIARPAGILGTFNISAPKKLTPEEYRKLYEGYEIANHCAHHPLVFIPGQEYVVADEPYNKETARDYTESDPVIYKSEVENVYKIVKEGTARNITDRETYLRFASENRKKLEEVFGEGSIKAYVWPYTESKDKEVYNALCKEGYTYIRATRKPIISNGDYNFNIPEDKTHWCATVSPGNLLSGMEMYENYPDDGNLKFFSIGVHARSFKKDNKWEDLKKFAEKYANRPNDYYYATNVDIVEYEAAVKALIITEDTVENPTDKDVYMTVSGERVILKAKTSLKY